MFSYPVVIDGAKVGILRYYKDFTQLYQQSNRILDITLYITLAIFSAAFLFSYMLSRHITLPLGKLAHASSQVKNGNLDTPIHSINTVCWRIQYSVQLPDNLQLLANIALRRLVRI